MKIIIDVPNKFIELALSIMSIQAEEVLEDKEKILSASEITVGEKVMRKLDAKDKSFSIAIGIVAVAGYYQQALDSDGDDLIARLKPGG